MAVAAAQLDHVQAGLGLQRVVRVDAGLDEVLEERLTLPQPW